MYFGREVEDGQRRAVGAVQVYLLELAGDLHFCVLSDVSNLVELRTKGKSLLV